MDLADVADVADTVQRELTPEEEAAALPLIKKASARVRGYTGQTFDYVENDVIRIKSRGPLFSEKFIRLPQWPVIDVTSVRALDMTLPATEVVRWQWFAGQVIENLYCRGWYEVTYSHGFQTIDDLPEELRDIVAGVVVRKMFTPTGEAIGVRSQLVGSAQEMYAGDVVDAPSVKLSADDKEALKKYKVIRGGNARLI